MGIWTWIARKVKSAVLQGFADAVEELETAPPAEDAAPLSLAGMLQRRLTALPPAAPEAEPVANGRGRKAVRDA